MSAVLADCQVYTAYVVHLTAWARDQQRVHGLTWTRLSALSKSARTDLQMQDA